LEVPEDDFKEQLEASKVSPDKPVAQIEELKEESSPVP